ncbi:MAG TPA: hypothetical protein VI873_01375 [Candidatus Peribacteraceae bacterium]|nr:hypothetical protein [Candidatus Peribacteraceae bacterium]
MAAATDPEVFPDIGEYMETSGPVDGLNKRLDPKVLARLGNIQRLEMYNTVANNT